MPQTPPDTRPEHVQQAGSSMPQPPSAQCDFDRKHEEGLNAILAWEEATTSHIQRAKAQTLDALSSLDEDSQFMASYTVADCEKSLARDVAREKKRRLERLSARRDRDREREEGLHAIRVWEEYTTDRIRREKGRRLDRVTSSLGEDEKKKEKAFSDVAEWERSTVARFGQERMRRLDRLPPLPDLAKERCEVFLESLHWDEKTMVRHFERETRGHFELAESRRKRHGVSSAAGGEGER